MITSWAHDAFWEVEAGVVRPYLFTQGRTHPGSEVLVIEAMVETTPLGRQARRQLPLERRRIVELCDGPQSIAEVAAKLHTPLGVVRVLVGDLAAGNLVSVHDTTVGEVPDVDLLQRLIDRVKAIPV